MAGGRQGGKLARRTQPACGFQHVAVLMGIPVALCPANCRRRYGFVRFGNVAEAQSAIAGLDGNTVLGHTLQVKFADADAGPPSTAMPSGLTPSDSCYVKHLPATYGVSPEAWLLNSQAGPSCIAWSPAVGQADVGSGACWAGAEASAAGVFGACWRWLYVRYGLGAEVRGCPGSEEEAPSTDRYPPCFDSLVAGASMSPGPRIDPPNSGASMCAPPADPHPFLADISDGRSRRCSTCLSRTGQSLT